MTLRHAWTLLALLLAPLALPARGDVCDISGEWGGRGIVRQYVFAGGHLYAADGRGVAMYDTSNPAMIRQIAVARTTSASIGIAQRQATLAVLTERSIEIYGIAPDSLPRLASVTTSGNLVIAATDDGFVTAGSSVTLWKWNGTTLQSTTPIPMGTSPLAFFGHDSRVWLATATLTLVFDTSSGAAEPLPSLPITGYDFATDGTRLYLAAGVSGIYSIDLSSSSPPLSRMLASTGDYRNIAMVGSRIYLSDQLSGSIRAVDASDPTQLELGSAIVEPVDQMVGSSSQLIVSGSYTFKATNSQRKSYETGLPVRVFTPAADGSLVHAGDFSDLAGPLLGAATDGRYAYVVDPPLFRVIDISTPERSREVSSISIEEPVDRVRLAGPIALVYGTGNVYIIDVSDPLRPQLAGTYLLPGSFTQGADMAGPYLVDSDGSHGLHLLDISDPANPTLITALDEGEFGEYQGVVARAGVAYNLDPAGVQIADLTNPHHAAYGGVIHTSLLIDAAVVRSTDQHPELFIILDRSSLRIFDNSDPLHPQETAQLGLGGTPVHLTSDGNFIYAVKEEGSISQIDVSDSSHPVVTGEIEDVAVAPGQIAAAGGRLVLADTYELRIFDEPFGGEITDSVVLSESPSNTAFIANLTWSSTSDGPFEIQTATDDSFTEPSVRTTRLETASITLSPAAQFVRVRAVRGCDGGPFSNVVQIEPDPGTIRFLDSQIRQLVGSETSLTVDLAVTNSSSTARSASFTIAPGATVTPSLTLPAGGSGLVTANVAIGDEPSSVFTVVATDQGGSTTQQTIQIDRLATSVLQRTDDASRGFIPGVASIKGANLTRWKSDLTLHCRASAGCSVNVAYSPYGATDGEQSVAFGLASRETVTLTDVVASIFNEPATAGTIEITTPDPDSIQARAFTYNESPTGRFGQTIPLTRLLSPDEPVSARTLLGVSDDGQNRMNLGFLNTSGSTQMINLVAHAEDGTVIASAQLSVGPFQTIQGRFLDIFDGRMISSGTVSVDASPAVIAFGSRIDQVTGDGVFSYAADLVDGGAESLPLYERTFDAASSTGGANGSRWRTAIQLASHATSPQNVDVTFIPAFDAGAAQTVTVTLPPGGSYHSDDVANDLFAGVSTGDLALGRIRMQSGRPFSGWGNIYNIGSGGSFGQYLPARDTGISRRASALPSSALEKAAVDKVDTLDPARLPTIFGVEETTNRRTNFGLTEISGKPSAVSVRVFSSSGNLLATKDFALLPGSSFLATSFLSALGLGGLENVSLELDTGTSGRIDGYASMIENATSDASYIPAE